MNFFYCCPFCEQEINIQSNAGKPIFCPACEKFYQCNNRYHYYSCLIPNKNEPPENNNQSCVNYLLPILFSLLPWCNYNCKKNYKPKYYKYKCKYRCKKF